MPEVLSPENKPPSTKTADDINDLFKTLDQEEVKEEQEIPVKKEAKKEETSEEEEIDEDEIKIKEPEEEEEKLDLDSEIEIDAPPKKREILKKYPDIFKDFPFMEKVLYRDKQYNELFGSFDDAKEVAERVEIFNDFESDLASGNTESILKGVKESDSKAFNRIVDNYLPSLARVDKDAYFHVIGNLNKRLIQEMVEVGNSSNDDDLKQAALIVNRFLFMTDKWTAPSKLVNETEEAGNSEVEKERASLIQERFETVRDELQTQIDNTLKATISEYIDPKGQMSAYVKKNAIADAMRILTDSLASDESVTKNLNKLWRSASESKFSKDDIGKIKSFYLGRGRNGLKNAILKARAEALKDLSPKAREKEEIEEEDSPKRRQIPSGRPSQSVKKNEMKKGESVADFFARD